MAKETPAERQERIRKFAQEHNKKVAEKQTTSRDAVKNSRENLDKKDSES